MAIIAPNKRPASDPPLYLDLPDLNMNYNASPAPTIVMDNNSDCRYVIL